MNIIMATLATSKEPRIYYPESDGQPMAENTIQFRWITTIQGCLDILFRHRPDVFVAGDNLWYPIKGKPEIRLAPDVYVAFGRPKGDRGNYLQWKEDGIPPAVVFEVRAPSNTTRELLEKFDFYQKYGAREYYYIDPQDPERTTIEIFERESDQLKPRHPVDEWVSPLMGVRFIITPTDVKLYYPDGKPFLSFVEMALEIERLRMETERLRAKRRIAKLAARLRELGVDPDAV